MSSDFQAVMDRAYNAVLAGLADVTVREVPVLVEDQDFDSPKGRPTRMTTGEHRVAVHIEWTERQP